MAAFGTFYGIILLTAATNSDPFGPHNEELVDLSVLSHDYKNAATIANVLEKRILGYLEHHKDKGGSSGDSSSPTGMLFSRDSSEKDQLVVSKTLTVILYLLQFGSGHFLEWVRNHYNALIRPLKNAPLGIQHRKSVRHKAAAIVGYCEDCFTLQQLQEHIEKMRLEMASPGVKHPHVPSGRLQKHTLESEKTGDSSASKRFPSKKSTTSEKADFQSWVGSPSLGLPRTVSHFAPNFKTVTDENSTIKVNRTTSLPHLSKGAQNNPFMVGTSDAKYRNNPFVGH